MLSNILALLPIRRLPLRVGLVRGAMVRLNHLREVETFVCALLPPEKWEILRFRSEALGSTYGIGDQLLVWFSDHRHFGFCSFGETVTEVRGVTEKYGFLLEPGPKADRRRRIFMEALANVVWLGVGAHFSWHRNHRYEFISSHHSRGAWIRHCRNMEKNNGKLRPMRKIMRGIFWGIRMRYPRIPGLIQRCSQENFWQEEGDLFSLPGHPGCGLRTWEEQLVVAFYRQVHWLNQNRRLDAERFGLEFFQKYRWWLERMSRCRSFLLEKYKNRVLSGMLFDLGAEALVAEEEVKPELCFPPNLPEKDGAFDREIVEYVVGCLNERELEMMGDTDEEGREWSFGDQLMDRFYSGYPSFAEKGEIKEYIWGKLEEYRGFIGEENLEVIGDVLVDELERAAFVGHTTHLWNLEMEGNLGRGLLECEERDVEKAIGILVGAMKEEVGERMNVKNRLRARWRRARLGTSVGRFREHVEFMGVHSMCAPEEVGCEVELQMLLEEMDAFFLYPKEGREQKMRNGVLENGYDMGKRSLSDYFMGVRTPRSERRRKGGRNVSRFGLE